MAVASYKDLCIDAADPRRIAAFWGGVLGLRVEDAPHGAVLRGATPEHTIWINAVPEAKAVKHRVHLDVLAASLADLEALGARVLDTETDGGRWTVVADPEGGELCAFLRDVVPEERLHALAVDSIDHVAQAEWWGHVYGAEVVHHPQGYSTVRHVPGMPITTFDFAPVPERKAAKNRVHWDVTVADTSELVAEGATLLRPRGDGIAWDVLADPEGNEFCAFVQADARPTQSSDPVGTAR